MPKFTLFQILNQMKYVPGSPLDARIVCTVCSNKCEFGREIIAGRFNVCSRCAIRLQHRALEATGEALPRFMTMPYGTASSGPSADPDAVQASLQLERKINDSLILPPAEKSSHAV